VPVVYALGVRAVGRAPALLAAALFAIDPFAVWQGGEARPYGMLMFTTALSVLLLLVAVDARPWSRWWLAYAVSVAAVVYTHYTGAFVLVAQTLWALWVVPQRRRELLAASAAGVVLYLPWLPSYHGSWLGVYNALDVPLVPSRVAQTFLQGLIGHPAFSSLREFPGLAPTVLFLVTVAAGLLALAANRRAEVRARPVLMVVVALATLVGILLYAVVSYDLLLVRNLAASLPFALITVAWLVTSLRQVGRAPALVALAVVCGVYLVGAIKSLAPGDARADFRGALAWVNARSRPGDALLDSSLIPVLDGYRRIVPSYLSDAYTLSAPGTPQATAAWHRAQTGAHVFVLVDRLGLLEHYQPPRFDGADRSCQTATAAGAACVPLRATRTFDGLQQLVVAEYAR
jgi:4-amino-4-deoxy-L-arabinose transferase-like glycosyltransferase